MVNTVRLRGSRKRATEENIFMYENLYYVKVGWYCGKNTYMYEYGLTQTVVNGTLISCSKKSRLFLVLKRVGETKKYFIMYGVKLTKRERFLFKISACECIFVKQV